MMTWKLKIILKCIRFFLDEFYLAWQREVERGKDIYDGHNYHFKRAGAHSYCLRSSGRGEEWNVFLIFGKTPSLISVIFHFFFFLVLN